jgi:prefoldin beta subunit
MENSENKIQEMQFLEQNLHGLIHQKQAFQIELSETKAALKELKNADDEVFKIIGQLMVKSEKSKMEAELLDREKILDLRVKSLEKQEKSLTEKAELMREEIMKSLKA